MSLYRLDRNSVNLPENIAGNAAFTLTTAGEKENEVIELKGVLKEMPSFGLSTEWTEAPKNTFGKKVQEFFMGDLIEMAGFVADAPHQNQLLIDEWSSRMYSGTKNKAITLNFRIYPQNLLGQTTPDKWLKNLSKYATPSGQSVMSAGRLMENVISVIRAAEQKGKDGGNAVNEFLNLVTGSKDDPETPEAQEKRKEKLSDTIWKLDMMLGIAKRKVRQSKIEKYTASNSMVTDTVEHDKYEKDGKNHKMSITIEQLIDMCDVNLTWGSKSAEKMDSEDVDLSDKNIVKFKFRWPQKEVNKDDSFDSSDEVVDDATAFTTDCQIDVDSVLGSLQNEDSDWKKENDLVFARDEVLNYFREVLSDVNRQITEQKNDYNPSKHNMTPSVINEIEGSMASQFATEDRYMNVKFLASRLWALKIFPFIFSRPIIVAITDWKVTPSLEMMGNTHAYYDFSVTCEPDQVKSLEKWKSIIKYQ